MARARCSLETRIRIGVMISRAVEVQGDTITPNCSPVRWRSKLQHSGTLSTLETERTSMVCLASGTHFSLFTKEINRRTPGCLWKERYDGIFETIVELFNPYRRLNLGGGQKI